MDIKKVLAYGFNPLKANDRKTIQVLQALGFSLIFLNSSNSESLIKDLLAQSPQEYDKFYFGPYTENAERFILFATEDSDEIMPALKLLKRLNAQVDAKGVLTKINLNWPLKMLSEDMKNEHSYMTLIVDFYALSKRFQGMPEFDEHSDELAKIFRGEEPDFDKVQTLYKDLQAKYIELTGVPVMGAKTKFKTLPEITSINTMSSSEIKEELDKLSHSEFTLAVELSELTVGDTELTITWNDKETGPKHSAVLGEELETLSVSIESEKAIGKLTELCPSPLHEPTKVDLQESKQGTVLTWSTTKMVKNDLKPLAQELTIYKKDGTAETIFIAPNIRSFDIDARKNELIAIELAGHSLLGKGDMVRITL